MSNNLKNMHQKANKGVLKILKDVLVLKTWFGKQLHTVLFTVWWV